MASITSASPLVQQAKAVVAFPATVPSSADPLWINLQYYERVTAFILVKNATTVTGSAVTLEQATDTEGADSKALGFSEMFATLDTDAADNQQSTVVAADTFTTLATDNDSALYQIEIAKSDLDTANGFDCFRVALGNAVASTIGVMYLLWPPVTGGVIPSAIVD